MAGLAAVIMAAGLTACGPLVRMETPAPDGPRISGLEFFPARPLAGCPVRIRVHLDVGAEEAMWAGVAWVRLSRRFSGSGYNVLPVQPAPSGDVVASLVPPRSGAYSYRMQIGDQQGRWSNALSGRVAVEVPPAGETPGCS
ncbi:MAG TPA: hypothetical protein VFS98_22255 [Methylomirabilota bacterium]|nr:hypothetical protein [Methylomirabilota bacterium]